MSPRREPYKTNDGRNYTLWADVNDMMSALMPAYWSSDRSQRRERGWMFRGQASSEWELVPSLYRKPFDDEIINLRRKYTENFVNDLQPKLRKLGIQNITDLEQLAIAQHYGFYTSLLDFTWNVEIAAYFATEGNYQNEEGVLFAFSAKEYNELRNPFAAFGTSIEKSDKIFKDIGSEPLPDLKLIELYNIPRIFEQEGIFINVTPEKVETLLHECIDRFYFRQRHELVYKGGSSYRLGSLPSPSLFDSQQTYENFIKIIKKEKPEIFDRTDSFEKNKIFPSADPIAIFAEQWKRDHPDPSVTTKSKTTLGSQPISKPIAKRFSVQAEKFYYGSFSRSPYQPQYTINGRKLIEHLFRYSELDEIETQRWLLWELYKRNLPGSLKCIVKLGNVDAWNPEEKGVRVIVVDRWLADSYQYIVSNEQLSEGFWKIRFGKYSTRNRPEIEIERINPFPLPTRDESFRKRVPSNPHPTQVPQILLEIESNFVNMEEGSVGSFLFDLHQIVMIEMGRNLQLEIGYISSAPCLQASPLVSSKHGGNHFLILKIFDGFTGGYTYTAVCEHHANYMSEGEEDMMAPNTWMLLGLT